MTRAQTGALTTGHILSGRGIRNTLPQQLTSPNEQIAREPNPHKSYHRQPDVYCWCQSHIIRSTWERISRGLTESCGNPTCKEPK